MASDQIDRFNNVCYFMLCCCFMLLLYVRWPWVTWKAPTIIIIIIIIIIMSLVESKSDVWSMYWFTVIVTENGLAHRACNGLKSNSLSGLDSVVKWSYITCKYLIECQEINVFVYYQSSKHSRRMLLI